MREESRSGEVKEDDGGLGFGIAFATTGFGGGFFFVVRFSNADSYLE